MIWLLLALLAFADPFWQTKPVTEWTDIELAQFLGDSPWAQMAAAQAGRPQPGKNAGQDQLVQVYLASAGPVMKAVAERDRRMDLRRPGTAKSLANDPLSEERSAWLADNREGHVIAAVRVGNNDAFSSAAETRRMEQDSAMDLGSVKVKVGATFPPSSSDPHLYLAFPREQLGSSDKTVVFELYLPGVAQAYRTVTFKLKDMLVDGKLEM